MKIAAGLAGVFVSTPIWYYLFYQILVRVNASELMMFLFWVYVPIGIFIQIVAKVAELQ